MSAAKEVADNHSLVQKYKSVESGNQPDFTVGTFILKMFSMPDPSSLDEVLMWRQFDSDLSITHGFMAYIMEGGNNGMTKSYVDAFPDGKRFTDLCCQFRI